MKPYAFTLMAALAVAACGGDGTNPFDSGETIGDDGSGENSAEIPTSIRGDVDTITFDSDSQTLTVSGVSLDNTDYSATYTRAPALDVLDEDGNVAYQGYFTQSDALDRPAIGFGRESGNSGDVRAALAVTGGQFNRYFGGAVYERDGGFEAPPVSDNNQGLVTFAGRYVGLTNIQDNGSGLVIPADPGTRPVLVPGSPVIVEGNILLNADFADNTVNGAIYEREFQGFPGYVLPDIVLIATDISDDGRFSGTQIEFENVLDRDIGDYAGIFGGPNSEGVAGGVRLEEFDGESNPYFDGEEEYGIFVLDQCGTPDANATICDQVRPDGP